MSKSNGLCALTKQEGRFVKCHILPKALTRPSVKGAPLHQSTQGRGVKKRWDSWYDPKLVTRDGEDILASIDDAAIRTLKRHRLVWSSWIVTAPNFQKWSFAMPDHSFRLLEVAPFSAEALHRFAVSIVWRSAASTLPDMSEVSLSPLLIEELRQTLVGERKLEPSFLPTSLMQLSTRGETHNQSPYLDKWKSPKSNDTPSKETDIVRIYLDGLIFHVHLNGWSTNELYENPLFLGLAQKQIVPAVTYEASFQAENMLWVQHEIQFWSNSASGVYSKRC